MNRRTFFGWAATFAGAFGVFGQRVPSAVAGAPSMPDELRAIQDRLLDALPSRRHAAEIGRVHLGTLDTRPDAEALVQDITACVEMSGAELKRCDVTDVWSALKARTSSDFAAGRTVHVGGWVLGMTEARLFCLAAIA